MGLASLASGPGCPVSNPHRYGQRKKSKQGEGVLELLFQTLIGTVKGHVHIGGIKEED